MQQTMSNLSIQINHLQSTNDNLLQTISALQSTINNANLPNLTNKLQSISSKLIDAVPSNNSSQTNVNSLSTYLNSKSQTSQICNIPSKSVSSKFKVKSTTIQAFITTEGKTHFELIQQKTNLLMQMMDVNATKYIFRCKICHQYSSTNNKKVFKYIHGVLLNSFDITSTSYLKQAKRGIENHINDAILHIQSVKLQKENHILSSLLYIKVETVYFMLQRSSPLVVFEELMVYIQQLIDHFSCTKHTFCLDIGEKQQSTFEASRIIKIFSKVMKKQTIYVLNHSLMQSIKYNVVLFSLSIDGWSVG